MELVIFWAKALFWVIVFMLCAGLLGFILAAIADRQAHNRKSERRDAIRDRNV